MTYLFCFRRVVFKFICSRTNTFDQKGVGRAPLHEFESRLPKSKKILRHYQMFAVQNGENEHSLPYYGFDIFTVFTDK